MGKDNKWSIDQAHSEIGFKVRHLMISHVKGIFKTFDASIHTEGADFSTADIDLWIDADSVSSGDKDRDNHLKADEFLDIEHHHQITFQSHTIGKADKEGNHTLWGDLTIKATTKRISFNVHFGGLIVDPWGNERAGFTITGMINRKDWGLEWNHIIAAGGWMVDDEVYIFCEMELTNMGAKVLHMDLVPELDQIGDQ